MTIPDSVGFLGVGTLATAMVKGLRLRWPGLPIHLSPRSEAASRALAEGDGAVTRHLSNAAVVEASALVFLTMRPPQLDAAVNGLPFRAGQVVASCVAGTALETVARLAAPAAGCRVLPLPPIARLEGPLVLYPALPAAAELLTGMGELIEADDEGALHAYFAASAGMSSFFALQAAMVGWLQHHGATPQGAAAHVRSLHAALARTGAQTALAALPALVPDHETPGGLNQRVRLELDRVGWFDAVGLAFDKITGLGANELKTDNDA